MILTANEARALSKSDDNIKTRVLNELQKQIELHAGELGVQKLITGMDRNEYAIIKDDLIAAGYKCEFDEKIELLTLSWKAIK